MDIMLQKLSKSLRHLQILDRAFAEENHADKKLYLEIRRKITKLNKKTNWPFTDELYVGGKKVGKNGYGRQMILSDIITYIIAGRGYFFAVRNQECMESFIELILHLTNQLMIFDNLTVDAKLRKKVIEKMEKGLGNDFIKEKERDEENRALKAYRGPIGMPLEKIELDDDILETLGGDSEEAFDRLDTWFDSLLPKQVGLWGELIVYAYLLRQKIGYIWPLLLTQNLISGDYNNVLKVPDYVIIPYNIEEKVIGIEVGGGKETQSTKFSNLTGITIATKVNADNPKRCPICGKWLLFCPWVIKQFSDQSVLITKPSDPIRCTEKCLMFKPQDIVNGACPYASVKGINPKNKVMKLEYPAEGYHFHVKCALADSKAAPQIVDRNIVTYYPYIGGLEAIEHLITEDKARKIQQLEKRIKQLEREVAKSRKRDN